MRVLFVNSKALECGVKQFGLNLWRILQGAKEIEFAYCEPGSDAELMNVAREFQPEIVWMNFYPCTMPWVSIHTLKAIRDSGAKVASIYHEVRITGFDALIYPDPTFAGNYKNLTQWFPMSRPIPKAREESSVHREIPLISTSGFGFSWKGHERLTRMVVEQFARAALRLHLPYAAFGDADGTQARATAERCRKIVSGSQIELQIDHSFMEPDQFVDWLAESDLNAYLYDEADTSRGIASTTDHALAARKPIAITRTRMFRHLHSCSGIFVEDSTLPSIMDRGIEPLREVYRQFSEPEVLKGVEDVMKSISRAQQCRLLTNLDRERLKPVIAEMEQAAPEMMSRKIPEANVQQAWVLENARKTRANSYLCVGCFEDTAYETLKYDAMVVGIDPAINSDLRSFRIRDGRQFECVICTSVIEHVADDEGFIADLCDSLVSDGVCILTADFREGWSAGQPLPATDVRLYTRADILRLERILTAKGCYFVNAPDTTGEPDFHYQGHDYSFIGLVFKKL